MPNKTTLHPAAAVNIGYAEVVQKLRVLKAVVTEREHQHRSVDVQPTEPERLGGGETNAD